MPLSTIQLVRVSLYYCLIFNYYLNLDGLKLYGKSRSDLECLVKTAKLFSDAIHLKFGIDKCATASLTRGRLSVCDSLVVPEDTVIPALGGLESYRCIGT